MDHQQGNQDREQRAQVPVLYVAFELANSTWKMACSDASKLRHVTVTTGDLDQVQGAILGARRHFGLGDKVHTVSCYEAGRDGFWLHRYRQSCGIDNVVVDSASLEVQPAIAEDENRPGRCGKTVEHADPLSRRGETVVEGGEGTEPGG